MFLKLNYELKFNLLYFFGLYKTLKPDIIQNKIYKHIKALEASIKISIKSWKMLYRIIKL